MTTPDEPSASAVDSSGSDDDLDLGSATRALSEALAQLTRAVTSSAQESSRAAVVGSLRLVSRDIAATSERLAGTADSMSGRGQRRRRKAEATREAILAAARRTFAAKGYEGASVADIAAEAGFTKGALYASFSSKEALFLAVAAQLIDEQVARVTGDDGSSTVPVHGAQGKQGAPGGAGGAGDTTAGAGDAGGAGGVGSAGGTGGAGSAGGAGVPQAPGHAGSGAANVGPDCTDVPLEEILLGAEIWIYAVRHEESREELGRVWRAGLDAAAWAVAHAQGRQEPTQEDTDTAFGVMAIQTLRGLSREVLGPEEIDVVSARLSDRLLRPSRASGDPAQA